ncbi:Ankyrin repeat-containing domain protein [Cordyceps fumosorosea ARSEF 2679]|uniref:Ankyrin repeat-containing domain protein n=1 Tax=Cordyceps fumosorosea (strain ARSEF 2679) TaxID=1081104 RepID=A0A168ETN9_CORFA|nr:Ankyrin repeat-containing domain protein [Cordyceps fumosorosea ARSEF 2679]OAA74206.1 Ankyrin repeat-containing domain protein [Cordyceps fumosorosea ARSEF 2679]
MFYFAHLGIGRSSFCKSGRDIWSDDTTPMLGFLGMTDLPDDDEAELQRACWGVKKSDQPHLEARSLHQAAYYGGRRTDAAVHPAGRRRRGRGVRQPDVAAARRLESGSKATVADHGPARTFEARSGKGRAPPYAAARFWAAEDRETAAGRLRGLCAHGITGVARRCARRQSRTSRWAWRRCSSRPICEGRCEVVELLLDHGAAVSARDGGFLIPADDEGPHPTTTGGNTRCYTAPPTSPGGLSRRCWRRAAEGRRGRPRTNVAARGRDGETALHFATGDPAPMWCGEEGPEAAEKVRVLLEAGVEVNARTTGQTALGRAERTGFRGVAELLRERDGTE